MSTKKVPATISISALDEFNQKKDLSIVAEYPLTIYLNKKEIVTLMTIGQNPKHLCIGFLKNQNLISSFSDINKIQVDWETNSCAITTKDKSLHLKCNACGHIHIVNSSIKNINKGKDIIIKYMTNNKWKIKKGMIVTNSFDPFNNILDF